MQNANGKWYPATLEVSPLTFALSFYEPLTEPSQASQPPTHPLQQILYPPLPPSVHPTPALAVAPTPAAVILPPMSRSPTVEGSRSLQNSHSESFASDGEDSSSQQSEDPTGVLVRKVYATQRCMSIKPVKTTDMLINWKTFQQITLRFVTTETRDAALNLLNTESV